MHVLWVCHVLIIWCFPPIEHTDSANCDNSITHFFQRELQTVQPIRFILTLLCHSICHIWNNVRYYDANVIFQITKIVY